MLAVGFLVGFDHGAVDRLAVVGVLGIEAADCAKQQEDSADQGESDSIVHGLFLAQKGNHSPVTGQGVFK